MLPRLITDELLTLLGSKDDENKKEIELSLLTLLRFYPIEAVDKFAASVGKPDFLLSLELKDKLKESYKQARDKFFIAAPYFSRYSSPDDLAGLNDTYYYKQDSSITLKGICQRDMAYGKEREGLATFLLDKLRYKTLVPEEFQFSALPATLEGTKRAAALMERIAKWSYNYQLLNENKASEEFKTLRRLDRSSNFRTPMDGRYAWGKNLTEAVIQYSRSINIERTVGEFERAYLLTYPTDIEDLGVTRVQCVGWKPYWHHGQAPLSSTWVAIENLFEKILAMNLREAGKEKMREFYFAVAELVWLIGNSQPMERGSGSVAEIIMAVLHRHHGLKPPILKLNFPQLDVLDISFPLDDYQYMFPYFFEPVTLPPSLQLDPLKPCESMVAELEQIYRKKNDSVLAAICGQIQNRVCDKLNKEIVWLDENIKKPFSECDQKRYALLLQLQRDLMPIKADFSKKYCIISDYKNSFDQTIIKSLGEPYLDKYPELQEWRKGLCHALLVLTYPVSEPVKRLTTGSFFFSAEGKSKEAIHTAPKILKK